MSIAATPSELRQRNTFSIGLMIALSSWTLVFFTLVWGYVVFRMRTTVWMGDSLTFSAKSIADLNTVVLALSSWSLAVALKKDVLKPQLWAWSAFSLGALFLGGQLCLWQMVMASGLHWQKSLAGSFFFLLTGFHALHIVGALIAVLLLCLNLNEWKGSSVSRGIRHFWDLLFMVWMVMFVLIFIVQ